MMKRIYASSIKSSTTREEKDIETQTEKESTSSIAVATSSMAAVRRRRRMTNDDSDENDDDESATLVEPSITTTATATTTTTTTTAATKKKNNNSKRKKLSIYPFNFKNLSGLSRKRSLIDGNDDNGGVDDDDDDDNRDSNGSNFDRNRQEANDDDNAQFITSISSSMKRTKSSLHSAEPIQQPAPSSYLSSSSSSISSVASSSLMGQFLDSDSISSSSVPFNFSSISNNFLASSSKRSRRSDDITVPPLLPPLPPPPSSPQLTLPSPLASSSTTMMTTMRHSSSLSSPLPNDSCVDTRLREKLFLETYGFKLLDESLRINGGAFPYLVIHSRAFDSRYACPYDKKITIHQLRDFFSTSGHTLSIDNERSYVRYFSLDVDCLCRVAKKNARKIDSFNRKLRRGRDDSMNDDDDDDDDRRNNDDDDDDDNIDASFPHTNDATVQHIMLKVSELLTTYTGKKWNIHAWKKGCGYHIYTNAPVSLPMHLQIKKILHANNNFTVASSSSRSLNTRASSSSATTTNFLPPLTTNVVLEVPTFMPLPYSAKREGFPYVPMLNNDPAIDETTDIYPHDRGYYEILEYRTISGSGEKNSTTTTTTTAIATERGSGIFATPISSSLSSIINSGRKLGHMITVDDQIKYVFMMQRMELKKFGVLPFFNMVKSVHWDERFRHMEPLSRYIINVIDAKVGRIYGGVVGSGGCGLTNVDASHRAASGAFDVVNDGDGGDVARQRDRSNLNSPNVQTLKELGRALYVVDDKSSQTTTTAGNDDNSSDIRRSEREEKRLRRSMLEVNYMVRIFKSNEFLSFMIKFNELHFNNANDATYSRFVQEAAHKNGALYLQPYAVALHKALLMNENLWNKIVSGFEKNNAKKKSSSTDKTTSHSSSSSSSLSSQPLNDVGSNDFGCSSSRAFRRYVLEPLFMPPESTGLPRGDSSVDLFVRRYDVRISKCYRDTWDSILGYLANLFRYELLPVMSVDECVDKALSVELSVGSSAEYAKSFSTIKDAHERVKMAEKFVDTYASILCSLRVVVYKGGEGKGTWYVMNRSGSYRCLADKMENFLPGLNRWLNGHNNIIASAESKIKSCYAEFERFSEWTDCEFVFATCVGTFNSISGLYTATTGLLRFCMSRIYAVLPPNRVKDDPTNVGPYLTINRELIEHYESADRILRVAFDRFTDLFVHYSIVPAILQLRDIYDIDEFRIPKFFEIFQSKCHIEMAYFLVEYYPIDPKFIFLILYIIMQLKIEFNRILCYERLVEDIFHNSADNVSQNDWRNKFESVLAHVEYDGAKKSSVAEILNTERDRLNRREMIRKRRSRERQRRREALKGREGNNDVQEEKEEEEESSLPPYDRYMKRLLSIRHPDMFVDDEDAFFLAVLMAVCMIKCKTFSTFTKAFGVERLPEPSSEAVIFVHRHINERKKIDNDGRHNENSNDDDNDDDNDDSCSDSDSSSNNSDGDNFEGDDEFDDDEEEEEESREFGDRNATNANKHENKILLHRYKRRVKRLYDDLKVETSAQMFKKYLNGSINRVYGSNLTPFEMNLAKFVMMLGMSVCFEEVNFREVLNCLSTIFVTKNLNKLLIIMFGPTGTGKSWTCDIIMDLMMPDAGRFTDLMEAVTRANITTRKNIVILNEAGELDIRHLKACTGCDAESQKLFFSQSYDIGKAQSLLFGATNVIIRFKAGHQQNVSVDLPTISRIHALKFNGRQTYENNDAADSLFMMFTAERYYQGSVEGMNRHTVANCASWLSFCNYVATRDSFCRPTVNISNPFVRAYQDEVYLVNNPMYAFLRRCGISEYKDLYMSKTSMLHAVSVGLNQKYSKVIKTMNDFMDQFSRQYCVKLNDRNCEVVHHLQHTALIESIDYVMKTIEVPNERIDEQILEDRLQVYMTNEQKTNARIYFKKNNKKYFNIKTRSYEGILFVNMLNESYSGNLLVDSSSLIADVNDDVDVTLPSPPLSPTPRFNVVANSRNAAASAVADDPAVAAYGNNDRNLQKIRNFESIRSTVDTSYVLDQI